VIVYLIGGITLGPLWLRAGRAHARALRASADLMATKQAITGLARRTVAEWMAVVRVAGLLVLIGIVVVAMVVNR
jgi:hypothetical protein